MAPHFQGSWLLPIVPPTTMSRRRNYNDTGHAHELTFGCYRRLPLLRADRTCRWLADSVDAARESYSFDLWAYVFMPNHVHLLIRPRPTPYDIAAIRKAIKAPAARQALQWLDDCNSSWAVNLTNRRDGQRRFWQPGGGFDRNVTEPATLSRMIDYIHANPVRRGFVERSWDWRWSSAASYYNQGESPLRIDPIPSEWAA